MKTLTQIDELIRADEKFIMDHLKELTDKQVVSIQNKVDFYKYIKKYLEFKPSEDFCKSEFVRLGEQRDKTNERFERWKNDLAPKNVDPKMWRSIFNKETGLTKVLKQIKTLDFILDESPMKPRKAPKPKKVKKAA